MNENDLLEKSLAQFGGLEGKLSTRYEPLVDWVMENGLITNCIEFPACRRGEARFRFQVTPNHSESELERAADIAIEAVNWAKDNYS